MYNEFGIKHYKGKWPCTAKTLYSEKILIGRLQQYFWSILKLFLFRQQIPYFCWYYLYWAAHNGSNYLNGHCFVRVMLCVPVWNGDKVSHLSLHIYRETGWENRESISDWSKQCFVFVACEEQDKEKLEEYITELHKKYKHKQNRD